MAGLASAAAGIYIVLDDYADGIPTSGGNMRIACDGRYLNGPQWPISIQWLLGHDNTGVVHEHFYKTTHVHAD